MTSIMQRIARTLVTALGVMVLVGCVARGQPPIADRSPVFGPAPNSYLVQTGDTLYSIAWRYGLDVHQLAQQNRLSKPFTIYPKQRLTLSRSQPVAVKILPQPNASVSNRWRWPVDVAPLRRFGERLSGGTNPGVDYQLPPSSQIRAANRGLVVYVGPGLRGYDRLIIVEHDHEYLSAYAFSGKEAVNEQQRIKAGTVLAETPGNNNRLSRLHFEVRLQGQPVNPRSVFGG